MMIKTPTCFFKNAVAEELNYWHAQKQDFSLFGFAIEYQTLAPKMLVIYNSDLPIDVLQEGALYAKDSARDVDMIELSVEGVASICRKNTKYQYWGPTSRLVAVLALMNSLGRNIKLKNNTLNELKRLIGKTS